MLEEARIVMPHFPNAVSMSAHHKLRNALVEAFGGYTAFNGVGGWRDGNGKLINDDVTIYDVAVQGERDAHWDILVRIALEAGRALDQQSVYVRYPDGSVEIAPCEKPVGPSDEDDGRLPDGFDRAAELGAAAGRREKASRLLDAFVRDALVRDAAETGIGIALIDPAEMFAHNTKEMPQTGQLWGNRAGDMVWVGRRCTVDGGGWYATETRTGFEYVVDLDGHLLPHIDGVQSHRDLVRRIN